MFCGIIIVHRVITYFPTYSGFKYENLTLTNVILAFLVVVLSLQTKLGIKVNILSDRLLKLFLFFVAKNVIKKVNTGTVTKNKYIIVSLCTLYDFFEYSPIISWGLE